MRRTALILAVPLLIGSALHAGAAPAPKPQVVDRGGDSLATKDQDIKSVLFQRVGDRANPGLRVTFSTWSPVMTQLSEFNYEVQATVPCGTVSFTFSPGTPYQAVTGKNGWTDNTCGKGSQDLVTAQVHDNQIVWTMPLDPALFTPTTVFKDFVARIDAANPAVPFPSSATQTELGLIDKATGTGPWRLG